MNFFETTILSYLIVSIVVALGIGIALLSTKQKFKKVQKLYTETENELTKTKEQFANLELKTQQQLAAPVTIPDIPCGIITIDKDKSIGALNKFAEDLLGQYTIGLHGRQYLECLFFKNSQGALDYEAFDRAFSGTTAYLAPWTILTTKDTEIPIVGLCTPSTSGITFTFLPAENLFTSHNHTQELFADATNRLTDESKAHGRSWEITQSCEQCILVSGPDDTIIYSNPKAELFFGSGHDELLGKNVTELFLLTEKNDTLDPSIIAKAKHGEAIAIPRWRFLKTHGGTVPITGSVIPIRTDTHAGELIFFFANASRDFEEIEQEKTFFSGAAHDLRAPLTNIRSVIELLQHILSTQKDPDIEKLLTNAESSTLQLIALVNDLLNVSRIEQNRIVCKKESFDIISLTEDTLKSFQQQAREKHLFLEHPIPDLVNRKVIADKMKTQEILSNLISNALKYTMQGGVSVTHKVSEMQLITTIKDTGMGITAENQKLLFRKFQQISVARNLSVTKSTGLGLYIAKEFAKMMDGDILLEHSAAGEGSTFVFSLPLSGS